MSSPHITNIFTNLKRPTDVKLGRKVLIIGENGAGKSGLVDALSLVTTGVGRSPGIGKGRELTERGGFDGNPVEITAALVDGQVLTWPGAKTHEGTDNYIRAVDALYGAPKAFQTLILSGLARAGIGQEESTRDAHEYLTKVVAKSVPAVYQKTLSELVGLVKASTHDETRFPVLLAKLSDIIAGNNRSITGEVKALKSRDMVEPLNSIEAADHERLRAIAAQVPDFRVKDARAQAREIADKLRSDLIRLEDDIKRSVESTLEEQARLAPLRAKLAPLTAILPGLLAYAEFFRDSRSSMTFKCPLDGGHVTVARLRTQIAALTEAIGSAQKQFKALDTHATVVDDKRESYRRHDQRLKDLDDRVDLLEPLEDTREPEDLVAKLEQYDQQVANANQYSQAQGKIVELETKKQTLSAIAKAAQKASAAATDDVLDIATTRVNRLLPPRVRVQIEKVGSFGAGCSLEGRIDNGRWVPFRLLGGAERALVSAAVASAFGARGGAQVDMLIIDEVWLSRPSVTSLISLIDQAVNEPHGPGQAVLSVVEYQGRIPDDWTVVRLSAPASDTEPTGSPDEAERHDSGGLDEDIDDPPTADPFGGLFGACDEHETPSIPPIPPLPPPAATPAQTPPTQEALYGVERLGDIQRAKHGTVPVYWLGAVGRLTHKVQEKLLAVSDVAGSIGVVLSGKKKTIRTVTTDGKIAFTQALPDEEMDAVRKLLDP